MELSNGEKLILMMLADIYKHLEIQGDIDPDFVTEVVTSGHTWALEWQYPGIFEATETPTAVVDETADILEMWDNLQYSYDHLSDADKAQVTTKAPYGNVTFRGFDGNNESEYLGVARLLTNRLERFTRYAGRDLNSHNRSLETYRRMWSAYEPLRSHANTLTAMEIITILNEQIHPENRG